MSCYRPPAQMAVMANSLFHSLQGQYFVGYADNISFTKGNNAWAGLVNPRNSEVNLFVNVWTVTSFYGPQIQAQIWFNSTLPGTATKSNLVTPSNTAICPLPKPKIKIMKASDADGTPTDGVEAFARIIPAGQTVAEEEDGKFIIPPGGNFAIFLTNPLRTAVSGLSVAFGWWESRTSTWR